MSRLIFFATVNKTVNTSIIYEITITRVCFFITGTNNSRKKTKAKQQAGQRKCHLGKV
jgi:hypothetical protein